MGKVLVSARIENISDSLAAHDGRIRPDQVRAVEISEAMVDTGAKLLGLPRRMVQQLGLDPFETREAQTSAGKVPCAVFRAVWLTVEGRQCSVDVSEVSDDCPVLIGHVPLELLDFVVDPTAQRLIPNPKDGGGRILDLLQVAVVSVGRVGTAETMREAVTAPITAHPGTAHRHGRVEPVLGSRYLAPAQSTSRASDPMAAWGNRRAGRCVERE